MNTADAQKPSYFFLGKDFSSSKSVWVNASCGYRAFASLRNVVLTSAPHTLYPFLFRGTAAHVCRLHIQYLRYDLLY